MSRRIAAAVAAFGVIAAPAYAVENGYIDRDAEGDLVFNLKPNLGAESEQAIGPTADASVATTTTIVTPETTVPTPPCVNVSELPLEVRTGQMIMPLMNSGSMDVGRLPELQIGNFGIVGSLGAANELAGRPAVDTAALGEQITGIKAAIEESTGFPAGVGLDEEGGTVQRSAGLEGVQDIPSASEQTANMDLAAITDMYRVHSEWLVNTLGITINFAPVTDVGDGAQVGPRSYGTDVDAVVNNAGAALNGIQEGGLSATLKHYPGLGEVEADSHEGAVQTPAWGELQEQAVPAFDALIDQGARYVMMSHAVVPDLTRDVSASVSPMAYSSLRNLGFEGVVITDDLSMGGVVLDGEPSSYGEQATAAVEALTAGADIAMINLGDGSEDVVGQTHAAITAEVQAGRLNPDPAVKHILDSKGVDTCD